MATKTKKRRTRKYRPDKRFKEMRAINDKNLKATFNRLAEYPDDSYLIAPKPGTECRYIYNILKKRLIELNALIIVDMPEYGNTCTVKVNKDYKW